MEMYTLNLNLHRSNLTLICSRAYKAARLSAHYQRAPEAEAARQEWLADVAAESVATFYFYDSYTGAKR